MPSPDYPYRIQGLRVNRREVLRYAFVAGVGLVAIPLIGCGKDEEEVRATSTPVATAVPPSGSFDSDGVRIHYETFGDGYPIVLVHGYVLNITWCWENSGLLDALSPVRRVVALDCRGHGQSDKPHDTEAYALENMAGDVLNLMDYLGIEKADLLGYSMGGVISCHLLAYHTERFRSAVLTGPPISFVLGPTDESRAGVMARAMLADDISHVTDPTARPFRALADAIPNSDLEALAACARSLDQSQPIPAADLAGIDIPVVIINGENDNVAGNPGELVAAIPGARQVLIPDADHLVVFDPRFKEPLLSFLDEQAAVRPGLARVRYT
jgi:pimeloyl-ACP methyl ester carboxylesterase